MDPSVSIVITTYNQAAFIEATVRSALAQTYPRCEVIVVDDGSSDETPERLATFGSTIRYIRQDNRGVAGSRNTGIRQATGELLAFLDGDDIWEPGKIAAQVAAYQAHPRSGLIAVDTREFTGPRTIRSGGLSKKPFLQRDGGDIVTGRFYRELLQGNFISTTSQVMIPAHVLRTVGLSDERFRVGSDYDLYLRIASAHDLTFVKRVLANWRYLPTSASGHQERRHLVWLQDDVAILKKHVRLASSEWRPVVRQALRARLFAAARAAYYYGCDADKRWAISYLTGLWTGNRPHLWSLVFCLGLSCSPAARKVAGLCFKPVFERELPLRRHRRGQTCQ
jgi:glycosyltransferase involved in cell wall biosynthesis